MLVSARRTRQWRKALNMTIHSLAVLVRRLTGVAVINTTEILRHNTTKKIVIEFNDMRMLHPHKVCVWYDNEYVRKS